MLFLFFLISTFSQDIFCIVEFINKESISFIIDSSKGLIILILLRTVLKVLSFINVDSGIVLKVLSLINEDSGIVLKILSLINVDFRTVMKVSSLFNIGSYCFVKLFK